MSYRHSRPLILIGVHKGLVSTEKLVKTNLSKTARRNDEAEI